MKAGWAVCHVGRDAQNQCKNRAFWSFLVFYPVDLIFSFEETRTLSALF